MKPIVNEIKPLCQPSRRRLHQSFRSQSFRGLRFLAWTCGVVSALIVSRVEAQVKYTPDHPEVKRIADRAVEFLQERSFSDEHVALAAVAIVAHGKRYNQEVPKDNEIVRKAIEGIKRRLPPPGAEQNFNRRSGQLLTSSNEIYYPCLAIILMAETDAKAYKNEIETLLRMLESRQNTDGAFTYLGQPNTADTSQTQFAVLAMLVAKIHGFRFDLNMPKNTLEWFCASQLPAGNWNYKLNRGPSPLEPGQPLLPRVTLAMHAAGAGSVYLLADLLQLNKRVKNLNKTVGTPLKLPKSVAVYVEKANDDDGQFNKKGPLVKFDRSKITSTSRRGNAVFEQIFETSTDRNNLYYLYAFERYAFFREQAEGNLGSGRLVKWYDETVEYLKSIQEDNGGFPPSGSLEPRAVATAFAVLVLVRSSEILVLPPGKSTALGGQGFPSDTVLRQGRDGRIQDQNAEQQLDEILELLKQQPNQQELKRLSSSLKKQISQFRRKDSKSKGEIKAFLQSMISAENYFRRLIAVRFLASEQDMDNVPALIYALGDPDFRICLEAHDGLRLISRKLDSIKLSDKGRTNAKRDLDILRKEPGAETSLRSEFNSLKKKWTAWLLTIRPDADLLD